VTTTAPGTGCSRHSGQLAARVSRTRRRSRGRGCSGSPPRQSGPPGTRATCRQGTTRTRRSYSRRTGPDMSSAVACGTRRVRPRSGRFPAPRRCRRSSAEDVGGWASVSGAQEARSLVRWCRCSRRTRRRGRRRRWPLRRPPPLRSEAVAGARGAGPLRSELRDRPASRAREGAAFAVVQ
jgi:hypothetical protein